MLADFKATDQPVPQGNGRLLDPVEEAPGVIVPLIDSRRTWLPYQADRDFSGIVYESAEVNMPPLKLVDKIDDIGLSSTAALALYSFIYMPYKSMSNVEALSSLRIVEYGLGVAAAGAALGSIGGRIAHYRTNRSWRG